MNWRSQQNKPNCEHIFGIVHTLQTCYFCRLYKTSGLPKWRPTTWWGRSLLRHSASWNRRPKSWRRRSILGSLPDMHVSKISQSLDLRDLAWSHWSRDQIDAILQTTFSNVFSWMKLYWFRLKIHWSLFPRAQLTIFQHWFRQWLGADQATSHYLNQWWSFYWRTDASLGLNAETLTKFRSDWESLNINLALAMFLRDLTRRRLIEYWKSPRDCLHIKTLFTIIWFRDIS